jgi:hypothetical protein
MQKLHPLLRICTAFAAASFAAAAFGQRGGTTALPPIGSLEGGELHAAYDSAGLSSLTNPTDPLNGQVISRGGHLGITARYRQGDGEWQNLSANAVAIGTSDEKSVTYATPGNGPLKLTESFKLDGSVLAWSIDAENTSATPIEISDLAIVLPWNRPAGEDEKVVFEQGFTKHQFIEGDGSFIYFVRANGVAPYLLITANPGTKLEYVGTVVPTPSSAGPGRAAAGGGAGGAFAAYIHSAGAAAGPGNWRQPNTSLKLAAAGAPDAKKTYGFHLQWTKSYDDMRNVLYKAGSFDIRVVPGMTVPEDLTAKFSLHTQARIEGIDAEFPDRTTITPLPDAAPGTHLYEVRFQKLGENLLTIRHDGGRKTYLEFFSTESLETLIKKRAAFLTQHQQWRDPTKWYDGLYSVYDMQHKVLRSPEDTDGWSGRNEYILASDDTTLGKAPYVAEKNEHFPVREEIASVEYFLEHYVWGKLQRTDKEEPYPYGVYGIPNWHVQRDPALKTNFEVNANRRPDLANTMRVFRSYDYPHVTMLYYHMYEIARKYPDMVKFRDAKGYLECAYQTARAYFTYPYEILPNYYETYKWGSYNELVILNVIDALEAAGQKDKADFLRGEWEKKVKYFVYDDPYPYRSEYAFDRTAFESTYAFAKYGTTHNMQPDEKLWLDRKAKNQQNIEKWYSHPNVKQADSRAFMERQLYAGLAVRGWLEASYYLLGSDFTGSSDRGALSYMAPMGGSGILDYGINFSDAPADWLQLGYASYLSTWALMNTGRADTNYGFWFPGKENDGATGWTFLTAKSGSGWYGKPDVRGPWHYDGEIDLGYGSALRMARTVLTRDPTFGWIAYGGTLAAQGDTLSIVPRDGLRQRFDAVIPGTGGVQRIKLQLERDGFAAGRPIATDAALKQIAFTLENRTPGEHVTTLWLSAGPGAKLTVNGTAVPLIKTTNWDYPLRAEIKVSSASMNVELVQ